MNAVARLFADVRVRKAVLFVAGMVPMTVLIGSLFVNPSADPYERIAHITGEFTLRFVVATLAVSPIIAISGWRWLGPFRRTLGVLSFIYAVVHFAAYVVFEAGFDPLFLLEDIPERNFIAVGVLGFLLMLPLGLTSNNWAVRLIGGRRWKQIHRLAYPLGILACVHYLMQLRGEDLTNPLIYLGIVLALLAFRFGQRLRRRRRERAEASTA